MPPQSELDAEGRPRWVSQELIIPADWKAAWPLAPARDQRDQKTGVDIARELRSQTRHVLWWQLGWRALCGLERSQSTTPEQDAPKVAVRLDPQTLQDQNAGRWHPPRDLSRHGICPLKTDRGQVVESLEPVAGR